MKRLVVLISGSGTNLQAILDACGQGRPGLAQVLGARVVAVLSNRRGAFGLERARAAGVHAESLAMKPFLDRGQSRADYDTALAQRVLEQQPDLVVLAGFMHILSPAFLDRLGERVINLHPALPGELPGTEAIRRAWEEAQAGLRQHTGVMVHGVVPEVDAGPVLGTAIVPIVPDEPLESLEARLHATEHRLLVEVLRGLCPLPSHEPIPGPAPEGALP